MGSLNKEPDYIHCGTEGYGTLGEAIVAQLIYNPETRTHHVEILDGTGTFTGYDPTDEQILQTIRQAGTDLTMNPDFFPTVCANTRKYHEELFALGEEEITGVSSRKVLGMTLPWYPRTSVEARTISKLIWFGGPASTDLHEHERNTTTLTN